MLLLNVIVARLCTSAVLEVCVAVSVRSSFHCVMGAGASAIRRHTFLLLAALGVTTFAAVSSL